MARVIIYPLVIIGFLYWAGSCFVDEIHYWAENKVAIQYPVVVINEQPWHTYRTLTYPFWDSQTGTKINN